MIVPDLQNFVKAARRGNLISVRKEILADVHTPVSALAALEPFEYGFLLESVEGAESIGRYSFVGANPRIVFRCRNGKVTITEGGNESAVSGVAHPLEELKRCMGAYRWVDQPGLPAFCGGAVGYLGYNMVRSFEHLPNGKAEDVIMDDAFFMITDTLLVFDHLEHTLQIVANAHVQGDVEAAYNQAVDKISAIEQRLAQPVKLPLAGVEKAALNGRPASNISESDFKHMVNKAKEYIRAGDIIQVVLSQRFKQALTVTPLSLYRVLRRVNPSPYMYYLKGPDWALVGSSPEILVRCEDGKVTVRPIAGTIRRGRDKTEDIILEIRLKKDPKERAEHVMLVDLGRNDIGRVCKKGTVKVDELMTVERYSHVMHLVSSVSGELSKGKDVYDLLAATFPAGTVTGAPKIRAMQIIDELEPVGRGPYAGSLGYIGFSGNLDMCITIRTILAKGSTAYVQAGAGIVADSKPQKEYKETVAKAAALVQAIAMAEKAGSSS